VNVFWQGRINHWTNEAAAYGSRFLWPQLGPMMRASFSKACLRLIRQSWN